MQAITAPPLDAGLGFGPQTNKGRERWWMPYWWNNLEDVQYWGLFDFFLSHFEVLHRDTPIPHTRIIVLIFVLLPLLIWTILQTNRIRLHHIVMLHIHQWSIEEENKHLTAGRLWINHVTRTCLKTSSVAWCHLVSMLHLSTAVQRKLHHSAERCSWSNDAWSKFAKTAYLEVFAAVTLMDPRYRKPMQPSCRTIDGNWAPVRTAVCDGNA